jgi:malate dehydrogenase
MKVAVIGAGNVGATAAQRIAEADLANVVLLDIVEGKARALALDLSSASSIVGHSRSITGTTDYEDIAGADIVIITAGQTRKPDQSRADLLLNNGRVVKEISPKLVRYCPNSIVIVVTNPLDVMTYLAFKTTGFTTNRVIGMGGVCDCARFNMLVAAELNITSKHIQSTIIGAHSDSMVILPRLSTVQGTSITEMLPENRIKRIVAETRGFGANIVKLLGKGSAYYGPSAGIFLLVDTIINDRKDILCNCAYLNGQYGLDDLCIGVATKIGRGGIEEIIELNLTQEEKEAFQASAKGIRKVKEGIIIC